MSANRSPDDTYRQLTGQADRSRDQPRSYLISNVAKKLGPYLNVSGESFIRRFTLTPLDVWFSGIKPQYAKLTTQTSFIAKLAGDPAVRASVELGRDYQRPCYCYKCVVEDREIYGLPYWHLSHQPPEVTVCAHHAVRLLDTCPWCGKPTSYEGLQLPTNMCSRCGQDASGYSFNTYPVLPIELLAAKIVSAVLSLWQSTPRDLWNVHENIEVPSWSNERSNLSPSDLEFFIWSQQREFSVFDESVDQNKAVDPIKSMIMPWYYAVLDLQIEWCMGTRWISFLKILRIAHAIENGVGFWDAVAMYSPRFKPNSSRLQ